MRLRRWMKVSVRGVMLLVLIACLGLGWTNHEARVQLEAVAAVDRAQEFRVYKRYGHYYGRLRDLPPLSAARFVDRIGVDYFDSVRSVTLSGIAPQPFKPLLDPVDDRLLERIGRVRWLELLELTGQSGVTDEGLVHLAELRRLKSLRLGGTGVSRRGLVHLRGMSSLKELGLDSLDLRGADLGTLPNLGGLESLDLNHTQVDDAALAPLKGAKALRTLYLSQTSITSAGLEHLRDLPALEHLCLGNTEVDSNERPRGIPRLRRLLLNNCPIDDAGLASVRGITGLTSL